MVRELMRGEGNRVDGKRGDGKRRYDLRAYLIVIVHGFSDALPVV